MVNCLVTWLRERVCYLPCKFSGFEMLVMVIILAIPEDVVISNHDASKW